MIFSFGLLITLITYIYPHEGFIIFGILHCIGLSIMLSYPFLRRNTYNLEIGVILIIVGLLLQYILVDFPWLLWVGIRPTPFYTLDYFPLLPWFGVVLLGTVLGQKLYQKNKRRFDLVAKAPNTIARFLCLLGRHSLFIYLVHQPILIGIILLLTQASL